MRAAVIESIDRPMGGVMVWIAAHHEVTSAISDDLQDKGRLGPVAPGAADLFAALNPGAQAD